MDALKMISDASMKQEVPAFGIGDTVKVYVRIKEGDKSRIQVFEGTVIAKKHAASAKPLLFAVLHMAAVLSVFSRCTLRLLTA